MGKLGPREGRYKPKAAQGVAGQRPALGSVGLWGPFCPPQRRAQEATTKLSGHLAVLLTYLLSPEGDLAPV